MFADPWTFAIRKRKNETQHAPARSRTNAKEDAFNNLSVVACILEYAGASVMIQSTCTMFRRVQKTNETPISAVVSSASTATWAIRCGMDGVESLALRACVRYGKVDVFTTMIEKIDNCNIYDIIDEAIRYERLDILTLTLRSGVGFICEIAARHGRIGVLKWARDNRCPWDGACYAAAKSGHLETLQWLRVRGCPWDEGMCAVAAGEGHLEVLQWLRSETCPWDARTCTAAARNGHLHVLQWARYKRCPWDAATCSAAAQGGHLNVLQWARTEGCPWDKNTWSCASINCVFVARKLETFEWVVVNGCPVGHDNVCADVARVGNAQLLQWALANGSRWDATTCSAAAWGGHLEILQWARNNECPWDSFTCRHAAARGHVDVLIYARVNGCPWDPLDCRRVAMWGGHINILQQWVTLSGCPCDARTLDIAARQRERHLRHGANERPYRHRSERRRS